MRLPFLLLPALALSAIGCGAPEDETLPAATPIPTVEAAAEPLPPLPPLPGAPAAPFERAMRERMERVTDTLVEVDAMSGDEVVSRGSGVLVSREGHVLTAAHAVKEKSLRYRVVLPDGQTRFAEVVARDEAHDAALLRVPGAPTPFARLAAPPSVGDWVVCAGYGGRVERDRLPMRTAGVVVQRQYAWTVTDYAPNTRYPEVKSVRTLEGMLQLDCATAPGMSGGAVVDLDGNLVGVVVGADGIATPIEGLAHLLPASVRPIAAAPASLAAQPAGSWPDGRPSRYVALEGMLAPGNAARSLIELETPDVYDGKRRTAGVLASRDGLVVVPAVRIQASTPSGTIAPESIGVVGHEGAHCEEIVAVDGDLALLRVSGLDMAPSDADDDVEGLRPVGPAGAAALGALVATVDVGQPHRSLGFVTSVDRHPGLVGPDGPRWGCGWNRGRFYADHPGVVVTSALSHDAGWPRLGSLLVDREGRPLAFAIAERASGLAFAVPWREVTARFDRWLHPSAPGALIAL